MCVIFSWAALITRALSLILWPRVKRKTNCLMFSISQWCLCNIVVTVYLFPQGLRGISVSKTASFSLLCLRYGYFYAHTAAVQKTPCTCIYQ